MRLRESPDISPVQSDMRPVRREVQRSGLAIRNPESLGGYRVAVV